MSDLATLRKRMLARMPTSHGRWYDIRNANGEKAVVRIYDYIDPFGVTAEDFAAELDRVDAPEIEVQINSPGGLVFDGLAIYNALRTHSARITTRVDGIAASAASVVVQAGDQRVMVESAQLMIHEAWGIAIGPARELREFADMLDKQNDVIAGIYASRSEHDAEHFRSLMTTDTFLTDQESVDLGLADEVFSPPRKDPPEDKIDPDLRAALTAALGDDEFRRANGLPPIPTPPAGEREDPAVTTTVDAEQAQRLLAQLTLNKEA